MPKWSKRGGMWPAKTFDVSRWGEVFFVCPNDVPESAKSRLGKSDRGNQRSAGPNVSFSLLFSNHLLRSDDLANEYGNRLLAKLHDERNGVVVCDGVLADYVRERLSLPKTHPRAVHAATLT
jgi:hypothetical protein